MEAFVNGIFFKLPGLTIMKDTNPRFLDISEEGARLLGWKNTRVCVGKTDFNIPCDARHSAKEFIVMDKATLTSEKKFYLLKCSSITQISNYFW